MIANVMLLFAVSVIAFFVTLKKHPDFLVPFSCFLLVFAPLEAKLTFVGAMPDLTLQRLIVLLLLFSYARLPKYEPPDDEEPEPLPYKGLIVLSVLSLATSTLFSVHVMHSVKNVISIVLEMYVLYALLVRLIVSREQTDRMGKAFVVAAGAGCVVGLLYYFTGFEFRHYLPGLTHRFVQSVDMARGDRLRAIYPHAILMGGAISMSLPFLVLWIARCATKKTKLLLWALLAIQIFCMYKTLSRGPWLATGLIFAIMAVFCQAKTRKLILTMAVLGGGALLLRPGVYRTLHDLFVATLDSESRVGGSFSYRSALLRLAIETLRESPVRTLFGFGPGTFFDLQLEAEFRGRFYSFLSCDSSWISFLFGSGYVGFIVTGLLLGLPLRDAYRQVRATTGDERDFNTALLACLAGFYFMMTNVAIYDWGQPGYMTWILIAMCVAQQRLPPLSAAERGEALAVYDDEPDDLDNQREEKGDEAGLGEEEEDDDRFREWWVP